MSEFLICVGVFVLAFLLVGALMAVKVSDSDEGGKTAVLFTAFGASCLVTGLVGWAIG